MTLLSQGLRSHVEPLASPPSAAINVEEEVKAARAVAVEENATLGSSADSDAARMRVELAEARARLEA